MRKKRYKILDVDPILLPHQEDIQLRMSLLSQTKARLLKNNETLSHYANGHLYFGLHKNPDGWVYREWAPNATAVYLFGEFNDWNRRSHQLNPIGDGIWEICISGSNALPHG